MPEPLTSFALPGLDPGSRLRVLIGDGTDRPAHRLPRRVVLLEVASVEQGKGWYDSEEYRGPKALRFKTARTSIVLVEGVS